MKTALILTSIVLAGGTAAFWLGGVFPAGDKTEAHRPQPAEGGRPQIVHAIGYIEPVSEVRKLTFKAEGVVGTCPVQIGQTVKAGEILASLRNQDEQAAVTISEKELAVAKAEREKLLSGIHPRQIEAAEFRVARLTERVAHAQEEFERLRELRAQKAVSATDFDLSKTTLQQAKEELQEAQADVGQLKSYVRAEDKALSASKVELAEANLVAARQRLCDTILTAPDSGTVLEILKRKGDAVRQFDTQPSIVFADLTKMRVRVEVDERFVHLLRVGEDAVIYGRGLGDRKVSGRLVLIKPVMGNKTVFSRDADERKDLNVIQVFVEPKEPLSLPIGLQVDVALTVSGLLPASGK